AQRGQDHRGKLASALQHRASAWIARLQAAGAGGLHPGIRAGGPATPTSDAARAGATTIIALTIKLDPSVGAEHGWLRDRWGLCWQIVPKRLGELMSDPDREKAKRVTEAMLKMVKFDIAALEAAARG